MKLRFAWQAALSAGSRVKVAPAGSCATDANGGKIRNETTRTAHHSCFRRESSSIFLESLAGAFDCQVVRENGFVLGRADSRRSADTLVRALIWRNLQKLADEGIRAPIARFLNQPC